MSTEQTQLLELLSKECAAYALIPASDAQQKRDKKCFINGLMTACRVVGISFETLSHIIDAMPKATSCQNFEDALEIPTYIRNQLNIKPD